VASLPVLPLFTGAMWFRIFLPELLPDVDRILYLDVDTVAVDSLKPLAEIALDGYFLAAVTNVFQREHLHRPASLGLSGPESYFNSGVLLMNLDEMRDHGCTSALAEFAASRGPQLEWPDQDALNVVLGERRLPLHPRWNFMNSMRFPWSAEVFSEGQLEEARRRPAIRHFEGPGDNKPWHLYCERKDRQLYRAHLRRTPWRTDALKASMPRGVRKRVRTLRSR
jgi:lipopolysaccharide biosynthesis glycosyltransferase